MDSGESLWADAVSTWERKVRRGEVRSARESKRYDDRITRLMVAYGMLSPNEVAPNSGARRAKGGAR